MSSSSSSRADATLLPPPLDDRASSKTLEDVGALAVLHAMVDQRKARTSEPAKSEIEHTLEYDETPRSHRVPADSDAFLKAR
jgi:hypothetical protein